MRINASFCRFRDNALLPPDQDIGPRAAGTHVGESNSTMSVQGASWTGSRTRKQTTPGVALCLVTTGATNTPTGTQMMRGTVSAQHAGRASSDLQVACRDRADQLALYQLVNGAQEVRPKDNKSMTLTNGRLLP